jgi:hypothetical protein
MKKIGLLLFTLILPLSFLYSWKSIDNLYPKHDEGFYFSLTQELYLNFKNKPLSEAVGQLYFHKNLKPILHPVLAVPILHITNGDSRSAIALYTGLVYAALLAISFLFLNRHLKAEAATLGTLNIAFMPWVFGLSSTFNSELTFVTAAAGFFYTVYDQFDFQNVKKCLAAAICLSLMACLRPVETALIGGAPMLIFVIYNFIKKEISKLDLISLLIWILIFISTIIPPYFLKNRNWTKAELLFIFAVCVFFIFLLLVFSRKLKLNKNFQRFFGIFFFISTMWYAPAAINLFHWIFATNFGPLAIDTGNRYGKPLYDFIYFYLQKLGLMPWILVGLSLVSLKVALSNFFSSRMMVFIFGCLILPMLGAAITYNGDVRYYYSAWVILYLILISQALKASNKFYWSRFALITLLTIFLFYNLLSEHSPRRFPKYHGQSSLIGQSFFNLKPESLDLIIEPYKLISNKLDVNKSSQILIPFYSNYNYLDSQALTIIAREQNKPWMFDMTDFYLQGSVEEILSSLNKNFNYLIMGPLEYDWKKVDANMSIVMQKFVSRCLDEFSQETNPLVSSFKFMYKIPVPTFSDTKTYCMFFNSGN